jgi:hypothetical protein
MRHRQGQALDAQEVARIVRLLAETEMTLKEIADRMQCSHGAVGAVNRKYSVRDYGKRRSTWVLQGSDEAASITRT